MNPDVIVNVFKSGYSKTSERFKEATIYPHELDNYQKSILNFEIKKVFDSEKRVWQVAEGERNQFLDIEVAYKFSINHVRFNSGLNEDFMAALKSPEISETLLTPLLTDYELNHRQLVLYVVDCDVLACSPQAM